MSNSVKEKLNLCGIDSVTVVNNSVDINSFRNAKAHSIRDKLPNGSVLLIYAGYLTYTKGIKNLLKTVISIMHVNPNVYFAIAGDGELLPILAAMVKYSGLDNNIFIMGRLNQADIQSLYAASDIVLAPSLWQEPLGRTAIEAMAASKPIIASAVGGWKYAVKDGKTGYLISALNQEEWKEKIELLINDKEKRIEMGRNAGMEADNYSLKSIATKMESLCLEAIKKHKA